MSSSPRQDGTSTTRKSSRDKTLLLMPLALAAAVASLVIGLRLVPAPAEGPERDASSAGSQSPPPVRSASKPAGPAELGIVAPLAVGSKLEDFDVKAIYAVDRGLVRIVCKKDRASVELMIGLDSEGGPSPPAQAGRYSIFYSIRNAAPEDGERLAKALVPILEANQSVPPPPGMGAFEPLPIPI